MANPAKSESLKRQAYTSIRNMVTSGKFAPGDAIVESQIAESLGMSRAPVREALVELVKEGYVKQVGSRTRIVSELTLRDVVELYDMREMVEGMSARLASMRLRRDDPVVSTLYELADKLDSAVMRGDKDEIMFHELIVRQCGNSRLQQFADPVRFQSENLRLRDLVTVGNASIQEDCTEIEIPHRLIVDALVSGDPDRAESVARSHIRGAKEKFIRGMMR